VSVLAPVAPDRRTVRSVLEARGITKRFGDVLANDGVDIELRAGEVHALLGENGAGKSTLVKILYGFTQPDAGEILFDGRPARLRSPADARALGIGLVFQQFTLIPAFTVAENVALHLPDLSPVLQMSEIEGRIAELSRRYELSVDPRARVGRLSAGEQQRAEILRVLLAGARVVILDEPTSVLAAHEIDSLYTVMDKLRTDGYPVVFITHKLPEVLHVADRITVMRHGRVVGTLGKDEATEAGLVSLMFEHEVRRVARAGEPRRDQTEARLLSLRGISTRPGAGRPLHDVDLEVGPGEIVGVAGISGNGQRELGDVILGMQRCASGTRTLFGRDATKWSAGKTLESGVGFVPESAISMALIGGMTVEENFALASLGRYERRGGLALDWTQVREDIEGSLQHVGLVLPGPKTRVGTLSGGNVQRFAVARELARRPRLLIALYPTRGLDVPTAAIVQEQLVRIRAEGAGVLLFSHDLNELLSLSDRLLVLREGRVVAELDPQAVDAYTTGRLMTGGEG
jgi:general nucleoside transport system ATP-binding protein